MTGKFLIAALAAMVVAASPGGDRNAFAAGSARELVEAADRRLAVDGLDDAARARALLERADGWRGLGYLPRAQDDYRGALESARRAGDGGLERAALAGLGMTGLRLGDFGAAEKALRSCADQSAAVGDRERGALALVGLGALYGATDRRELSGAMFAQAVTDAEAAGDPVTGLEAAVNAARVGLDGGAGRKGVAQWLDAADRLSRGAPENPRLVMVTIARAELVARAGGAGSAHRAHELLTRALEMARRQGDLRGESFAWGRMADLYERAGRLSDAGEVNGKAIVAAIAAGASESLYLSYWREARLATRRGDAAAAMTAYERAAETLERVRGALTGDGLAGAAAYREQVEPLYRGYAEALLGLSSKSSDPAKVREALLRARAVMERLKAAELEDYFKDDCVAALDARSRSIDRLAPHTAAIYPILTDERLELLVSVEDGIRRVTVPVTRERLSATVREFRALLEKRATHQYREPARRLNDWLIKPLEGLLREHAVETLVFVPDGPLRTIPLAALHDGERFLVERYALSVSPGLTLIDPRPLEGREPRALVAGLSAGVAEFAPLPEVTREVDGVAELVPATVLRDSAFRGDALVRELRRASYDIVHIASHGEFSGDHRGSFLMAHDGRIPMERLEGLVALNRFGSNPVELLVLSACRTAVGDERAALGLAGVALKAGARSAMASLWYVSDAATTELMLGFYRSLKGGSVSKAEALRRAQAELLSQSRYRHPYYWAAYMVIGNWL